MGNPASYPLASVPYTGAEAWYCAQGGLDRRATSGAMFSSPPPLGDIAPNTGAFTALSSKWLSIGVSGIDGDGTTENLTAIQTALTAIGTTGGLIRLPPGVFKISGALTVSLAAGKHISFEGSGPETTILYFSGSSHGLVVNYGSPSSSVSISNLTVSTDTINAASGIFLLNPATATTNYNAPSYINNVILRGQDGFGASQYWANCVWVGNISNVVIDGLYCFGSSTIAGNGLVVQGKISGTKSYAVQIQVSDSSFNLLDVGAYILDYTQGLFFSNCGFVGTNRGIYCPPGCTGLLDQLSVGGCEINSVFGSGCFAIDIGTIMYDIMLSNNYFIVWTNAGGIRLSTAGGVISDNSFNSNSLTSTTALTLVGNGAGIILSDNTIRGFTTGITIPSGIASLITGNNFYDCTNDYNISGTSTYAYGNFPE